MVMGMPNMMREMAIRIMKSLISTSVWISSNTKKAVFSNNRSQSKILKHRAKLAKAANDLCVSTGTILNISKLVTMTTAVSARLDMSIQFQKFLK